MSRTRIKTLKIRNPIAKDLGSDKYHMRVVKSTKQYDRNKFKRKSYRELNEGF